LQCFKKTLAKEIVRVKDLYQKSWLCKGLVAINITIPLRVLLGLEFFNREAIDGILPDKSAGKKVCVRLRESAINKKVAMSAVH
jgi:hypothetical protein